MAVPSDITALCRNCGMPLVRPRRRIPAHDNLNQTILCLNAAGGLRNPGSHAEPTVWKAARHVR